MKAHHRRLALRAVIIAFLVIFEASALFWLDTYVHPPPARTELNEGILWMYGKGCIGVAIAHEVGGRFPHRRWQGYLHGTASVLGFGFMYRSSGLPRAYKSVTMIVVPMWPISLLSALACVYCIKREGLVMNWPWAWPRLRGERRGFEPIMRPRNEVDGSLLPSPRYSGERVRERGERRGSDGDGGSRNT